MTVRNFIKAIMDTATDLDGDIQFYTAETDNFGDQYLIPKPYKLIDFDDDKEQLNIIIFEKNK